VEDQLPLRDEASLLGYGEDSRETPHGLDYEISQEAGIFESVDPP